MNADEVGMPVADEWSSCGRNISKSATTRIGSTGPSKTAFFG
jgi:hypothetical protein